MKNFKKKLSKFIDKITGAEQVITDLDMMDRAITSVYMKKEIMKIKISSSVSNFKDKILKSWPVEEYDYKKDINKPVCFFGMYNENDYQAFLNHKGKKMIFWCGSDISNLKDEKVFKKYKNVCENEVEQDKLAEFGIKAEIYPTFAGNINDYPICKQSESKQHAWLCMHKGREEEYGLNRIKDFIHTIFHIYGIEGENTNNIIYHGQISEEQLDEEIKNYQIAVRLNKFEGMSEVIVKGILLGQIIVSEIEYPKLDDRDYWVKKLTNFNWLKI